MGRRTTSTTKGGKFMNPTDQARKEARRRELKKNKKQRIAVRQAVIKTKDPNQMIKELEDLDNMELDPTSENQYNEKVIKEKRRKLLETLIRIVDFYFKEDANRGREFKVMIENYKLKRAKKEMYYESVKNAQKVEINTIPLPETPFETPHLSDIPLPGIQPQSILKKAPPGPPIGVPPSLQTEKTPPGPPPGPPPAKKVFGRSARPGIPSTSHRPTSRGSKTVRLEDQDAYERKEGPESENKEGHFAEMEEDDEEFHHRDDDDGLIAPGDPDKEDEFGRKHSVRFAEEDEEDGLLSHITPLQAMMLKMAGQSIPAPPEQNDPDIDEEEEMDRDEEDKQIEDDDVEVNHRPKPPGPPPGLPPGPPPGMPPGMIRPGMLPPGPPPGRPPTMPPRLGGPRPDMRLMNRPDMMQTPNILSAPPSLIHRPTDNDIEEPKAATITAKPKLTTNLKVESTRFMPTSLRVRRETKGKTSRPASEPSTSGYPEKHKFEKKKKQGATTADAAYDSFMKEMQGLL
ncbi:WW domain-binding protein 11-like isoform X2 [Clavelina lepadiformis]|uniref:WW domain-binding protein 11-like isoform X2 n=1 Tax=Clavelina lepadiformis TaxID=159417 RepID=UPI004042AB83